MMNDDKNLKGEILPEEEMVLAYDKADQAKEKANTDSVKLNYKVEGSTYYLMVLSDNHNKLEPLMKSLQNASLISNMGVIFLGDQGKVSLPNSKTPAHDAKPLQVEIDTTKYAIEKSGIDVEKQVLAYLDGNHEEREKKVSSIEIGKGVAQSLGIMDRYAGNRAFIKLELDNPLKDGEKVPVTIFMSHGQGRGGGPGAEADKSLNNKSIGGVDIVLAGDTHKLINANKTTNEFKPGTAGRVLKNKSFSNFGTDLSQEEYLLEKGVPLRAVRDGEILRVMLVPNEAKTECSLAVDYINIRQVLTENLKKLIESTKEKLEDVENRPYYTVAALNEKYKNVIRDINDEKAKVLTVKGNKTKYPKELKLVVLSGLNIGQVRQSKEEAQRIEENLDKIINVVSKMDNCAVIINGDAIYYKQANLLHRINFPEETYAYLQTLAQKLEPIKDKIIAYNSGENEARIMKTAGNDSGHALKLADIAMKGCQIDRDLAYVHITQREAQIEKQKIQNKQVEKYNEDLLKKHYFKTVMDSKRVEELALYKKQNIDNNPEPLTKDEIRKANAWTKEEIEDVLVIKLRAEGKLLDYSTKKGKNTINKLFPLRDIDLKRPNPNLVQNILCKLLEINPNDITINSNLEETCDNFLKITNANNETQILNIVTAYKRVNNKTGASATRKAAEQNMSKNHAGADIYVTNGEEYITKGRETVVDDNGDLKIKDLIHVSSGNLSDPRTTTRVYEIRSEEASFKRIESGINEDTDNLTLTCSSKSLDSALQETFANDVNKTIDTMIKQSYQRRYNALQEDLAKAKTEKNINNMENFLNNSSEKMLNQVSKMKDGGNSKWVLE